MTGVYPTFIRSSAEAAMTIPDVGPGPRIYLDINAGMGMASGDAHVETHDPN